MSVYGEILILRDLIEALIHTVTVDSIDDDDETKVYVCNTYYLHTGSFFTIDDVKYTVQSFKINAWIKLDVALPDPTATFDIPIPSFYHGTPHAATEETTEAANVPGYQGPIIWLLEWVDIAGPADEFTSAVRSTIVGGNLFFLDDCNFADWDTDKHHEELVIPMQNEFDFVLSAIKNRLDIFGDLNTSQRRIRPHADFGRYLNDEGYVGTLLAARMSGIQVIMDIPYIIDLGCCTDSEIKLCVDSQVYFNGDKMKDLSAGEIEDFVIRNSDGTIGGTKVDDLTYETLAGGGDPTTSSYNGVGLTDTPSGEDKAITGKDSAGANIGTVSADTANALDIVVADSNVSNSNDIYDVDVVAEGSLELPDITHTDSDGSPETLPAQTAMVCTPAITPLNTSTPFKSGQVTSYNTNDDGADQDGNGDDFFALEGLAASWPHGLKTRFTDTALTQTYANDVVIDWASLKSASSTVLGYYRIIETGSSLQTYMTNEPHTKASISGWKIMTIKQLNSIVNDEPSNQSLNYAPFNLAYSAYSQIWTKSVNSVIVDRYQTLNSANGLISRQAEGSTVNYALFVREYTLAELGL